METNDKPKKTKEKKSTGCSDCKKKNKITTLPPPIEELYIPTVSEIKEAYFELINGHGVKEDKKPFISKVYLAVFDEEFNWKCNDCVTSQVIRYTNYMRYILKALP